MKLYLDLDGFLARFTTGACTIHNRPADETGRWATWDHQRSWGMTDEQFYAPMGFEFWRSLRPWEDGMRFLSLVEPAVGRENIAFLSSPVRTSGCEEGKRHWFAQHLPGYDRWADLFLGGAKHKFAHAGAILIDDSDANCERFVRAGGRALLVARPWNKQRDLVDENGLFHVGQLQDSLRRML